MQKCKCKMQMQNANRKANLILICQTDWLEGFRVNHEKTKNETATEQKNTCSKSAKRGLPSKNLNLFTVLHISVVVIESSVLRLKSLFGCDASRCIAKCKQKSKLDLNWPSGIGLDAQFAAFEILQVGLVLDAQFFRFQNSACEMSFRCPNFPLSKFCMLDDIRCPIFQLSTFCMLD